MDTKDLIEKLSERVHDAWAREKDVQGFHSPSYHEDGYTCSKCHSDMVPYEWLEDNIKEYDRVTVRTVLQALDELGVKLDKGTQKTGLNFGQALDNLKAGFKVARSGWNGKGMFIYLVKGTTIPFDKLRNEAANHLNETIIPSSGVKLNSHIDMKAADGTVVVGWLASQTDMLADDWEVVN